MGCRQCLHLSVVQLKGKHCRKPHCRNGVVDTFRQYSEATQISCFVKIVGSRIWLLTQKVSGLIVHQACNLDCRLWSNREMPSACKKLHISLISERNSIYCSQLSRCTLFLLCQKNNPLWNGNFSYCYDGKYRSLGKKSSQTAKVFILKDAIFTMIWWFQDF